LKGEKKGTEKAWLFDIVANKRNSLDVDKMDYLMRDNYACGVDMVNFDYKVIFDSAMVVDN